MAAERPPKKEEAFREERRRLDPTGPAARGGHPVPRSGPGNRAPNSLHPPPTAMGPPGSYGGSGSHKDIKLTLLTKVTFDPNLTMTLTVLVLATHRLHRSDFISCFSLLAILWFTIALSFKLTLNKLGVIQEKAVLSNDTQSSTLKPQTSVCLISGKNPSRG